MSERIYKFILKPHACRHDACCCFTGFVAPAFAQWSVIDIALNPYTVGKDTKDSIWEQLVDQRHLLKLAFKNALKTFLPVLPYDTAVALFKWCRGQTPFIHISDAKITIVMPLVTVLFLALIPYRECFWFWFL